MAGQPLNFLIESLGKLPCASGDNSILHYFLVDKAKARTRHLAKKHSSGLCKGSNFGKPSDGPIAPDSSFMDH